MQMCEKSAELDLRESYVLKYRVFKLFSKLLSAQKM